MNGQLLTNRFLTVLLLIGVIGVAATATAQSPQYWDPTASGGAVLGGSGTWSTSEWWNGSSDTTWSNGNDAYFAGTAGTVTIPATPTPVANNLYFNTNGYTVSGGALSLSGGTITVPTGDIATIASLVNLQNNYSVVGGGTLTLIGQAGAPGTGTSTLSLTNTTSMNIDSGTTLVLANSTGNFTTLSQIALGAGGTINGNLVISQPYQEIEFMPYAGTATQPAPGTSYTFSGSGAIYVAAPGTSLATHKNQNSGTQGWISNVNVPIYLNSSNLPFTPFDVTKPTFASSPVFGTAIGATKWSTLNINAPISGNADAVLTCNTYATGWGGSAITYLNAPCTYTGATMLEGNGALDSSHGGLASIPPGTGSLILGVSNALPVASNVEFDALTGNPTQYPVLDLNGNNTQVGSLTVPVQCDQPVHRHFYRQQCSRHPCDVDGQRHYDALLRLRRKTGRQPPRYVWQRFGRNARRGQERSQHAQPLRFQHLQRGNHYQRRLPPGKQRSQHGQCLGYGRSARSP